MEEIQCVYKDASAILESILKAGSYPHKCNSRLSSPSQTLAPPHITLRRLRRAVHGLFWGPDTTYYLCLATGSNSITRSFDGEMLQQSLSSWSDDDAYGTDHKIVPAWGTRALTIAAEARVRHRTRVWIPFRASTSDFMEILSNSSGFRSIACETVNVNFTPRKPRKARFSHL